MPQEVLLEQSQVVAHSAIPRSSNPRAVITSHLRKATVLTQPGASSRAVYVLTQEELPVIHSEMLVRVIKRSPIATTLRSSACSVVVTYKPPMLVPRARLPAGAFTSLTCVETFKNSSA